MFRRLVGVAWVCSLWTCGGSNPAAPPPTTPTPIPVTLAPMPTTLADLSASVTSPESEGVLSCDHEVRARVTLTNRGATGVFVTGVLKRSGVVTGDCRVGSEFVYQTPGLVVFPNSTRVVMDQALYRGGAGCCIGRGCAGSCRFQEAFEVVTEVGNVPAGVFNYRVFFQNCPPCSNLAAAGSSTCLPASLAGRR